MATPTPTTTVPARAPEIDWPAIRERATFTAKHQRLDLDLVDAIGPSAAGEAVLLAFAALSGQSLDYLVTGKRPHYDEMNDATTALSDLRGLVYALDRLTESMSYKDPEHVQRDNNHAIRMVVIAAWDTIEAHDKAAAA